MEKKALGAFGEEKAAELLMEKGYEIIARNFACRGGEIDLIAKDKNRLIFVEVKTRTNLAYGRPSEALTPKKLERLRRAAAYYLYTHPGNPVEVRFDVIEVFFNHLEGVM
ncbi:MAG: YraN family protein [Anaerovoracaceae bacterium]